MKTEKKCRRPKRRRTSLEIEEEQRRTLYIRLPHTIKDVNQIKNLFFGDFKVKIPRKTGRYCHVIFCNIEEKVKNLKALKGKQIDGKPVFAGPPKPMNLDKQKKKKIKQKKIVIPEPKEDSKIGKYLFISNIPQGLKASEIKDAFPESLTVGLLKGVANKPRQARVKMSSSEACLHYVKNKVDWPTFKGQQIYVSLAKKSKINKLKKRKKKSQPLKIYDGDGTQSDSSKVIKTSDEEKKSEVSDENIETESDEDSNDEDYEDSEENKKSSNEE